MTERGTPNPGDGESLEKLDTSMGHGAVACGPEMVRFVVSTSLPEDEPVVRYDDGTVLVSGGLPTKPSGISSKRPSQSQAIRKFINEERITSGQNPLGSRSTFATKQEIVSQLKAELSEAEE